MFIDTHAHLNFRAFDHDWQEAIFRAKKANVGAIINVGSNYSTSLKAIEIAKQAENVYAAVGLHPIHVKDEEHGRANKDEKFSESNYLKLAKKRQVVAIGETGLDYYFRSAKAEEKLTFRSAKAEEKLTFRSAKAEENKLVYYDKSTANLQKEVFQALLKISQCVSKPVIIHSREAAEDILPLLMAEKPEVRGVMHCFQENWQFAKIILGFGFYISFTGLITFTKNQETYEVIKEAPLDRILLETDCPYLTPEPYRGRRNEPAYVVEVAKKIAEIKKIPLKKVEEQTTKNAINLFKLDL